MATVKALLSQVKPNPFRDIEKYPFVASKLESLKDSMKTSGSYWENILARPECNEDPEFEDGQHIFNEDFTWDYYLEQAYGHHRLEVLRRMLEAGELDDLKGVEVVETPNGKDAIVSIPVQQLDDPTMLKIMANENKDDGTSPIIPLLESCRQTEKIILAELSKSGTYNEYVDAGGKFISNKAQWDQLKGKDSLGGKQIAGFFGETWSWNDVANAMRTIRLIETGAFRQEEVVDFPGAGMLRVFCAYVDAVQAKETWPAYFKSLTISKMAETISMEHKDKADKPTVRTVGAAAKGLKGEEELDGCLMARKGITTRKWNPVIHLKQVLSDDPDITDEQIIEQLNMGEFEGRDELIAAGRKAYEAAQKKKEADATQDGTTDGSAPEGSDELDQAIADAPTEGESVDMALNVENEPVEQRMAQFVVSANNTSGIGATLMDLGEEHINDPDFIEAVAGLKAIVDWLSKILNM